LNPPLKIVLDTNVVLDWFVFGNPGVAPVASAIEEGALCWIGSTQTRAELGHVLDRGGLVGPMTECKPVLTSVDRLLQLVGQPHSHPIPRWRCSDASDQKFIDLALAEGARWLLTRDRALLKLARKTLAAGLLIQVPEQWQLDAGGPVAS
jgi:predicted nucleic acid-binding protein